MSNTVNRYKYTTLYRHKIIHIIGMTDYESEDKLSDLLIHAYKFPHLWDDKFTLISKRKISKFNTDNRASGVIEQPVP